MFSFLLDYLLVSINFLFWPNLSDDLVRKLVEKCLVDY